MTARGGDRLPVVLLATVPVLAVRVAVTFLQLQARRKEGVRRFRRALEAEGMPRDEASRLAQAYHDAASIRRLVGAVKP
jgi:hypothetical protein